MKYTINNFVVAHGAGHLFERARRPEPSPCCTGKSEPADLLLLLSPATPFTPQGWLKPLASIQCLKK